jgi:hypothetical protein
MFRQDYGLDSDRKTKHYYVQESVRIACGFLPSPMGFLSEILERSKYEKPFLLIPAGYPAEGAEVPEIGKKSVAEVLIQR